MAAPKKKFDMEAVSKAAVTQVNALVQSGKRATAESVIQAMRNAGSDIAPTRLATLLKQLSDSNRLEGFYLRRGHGFVHQDNVPRSAKKAPKKSKSKAAKAPKAKAQSAVNPSTIAAEIDRQEAEAAEKEYRAQARQKARAALGLAG